MHIGIGDPVLVERSERSVADSPASSASAENTLLEGVVAYLGPQDFAPGNDWVGVRLTGASCGRGRNDGSVKGKRYFVCPEKCGVFVHSSAIRRRSLSRIEELRLRREIGSALLASPSSLARRNPADTDEQKQKLRENLVELTQELTGQLTTVTQEMKRIKSVLHGNGGTFLTTMH